MRNLGPVKGMYHIRRYSAEKGVYHHAILDVGNCRGQLGVGSAPAVFHMTYPELKHEWLAHTPGGWEEVRKIDHVGVALRRLAEASANPRYNLIFNNCEQFANYVSANVRRSFQLENAFGFAMLGLAAVLLLKGES